MRRGEGVSSSVGNTVWRSVACGLGATVVLTFPPAIPDGLGREAKAQSDQGRSTETEREPGSGPRIGGDVSIVVETGSVRAEGPSARNCVGSIGDASVAGSVRIRVNGTSSDGRSGCVDGREAAAEGGSPEEPAPR